MDKKKKLPKIVVMPGAFDRIPQADREAVMREFIKLVQSGELEQTAIKVGFFERIRAFFRGL